MPIYEYAHDGDAGSGCPDPFEVMQPMSEAPLERCPRCGRPCHRIISSFAVRGGERGLLSASNLEKHGFTQFKRTGKGRYEKTAGQGPRELIGE